MKVQVSQEYFDALKKQFLELDYTNIDPEIADTLVLFKNSPVLDKVVPRWSCQGHSDKARTDSFYIIFCTVDDGDDFLFDFTQRIIKKFHEQHGWLYLAGTSLRIVNLVHRDYGVYPHIQVQTSNEGNQDVIDKTKLIWKEAFDELIKEHYEL